MYAKDNKLKSARELCCDVYVFIMFFAFPLFVLPSGYRNITLAKWYFFIIATAAYALFEIFFMIRLRILPKLSASLICVLVFFAACCLSAVFSPYGSGVIRGLGRYEGLLTLFFYCLCFFVLSDKPFKPKYVYFLAASGAVFSVISLIQLLDKNPLGLYPGEYLYYAAQDVYSAAFLGTVGNVGMVAVFICVCVPMFYAFYVTSDEKRAAAVIPAAALLLFILLYSDVDAGKVGILFSFAVTTVILATEKNFRRICVFLSVMSFAGALSALISPVYEYPELEFTLKASPLFFAFAAAGVIAFCLSFARIKRPRLYIILLICIVTVASVLFVYFYDAGSGMLHELHEMMHGRVDPSFGTNRIRIWRESLALVPERPLLGGGPDTLPARLFIVFERVSEISSETLTRTVDNAHNEYINLLVNVGILGLIPFLALCVSSLFSKNNICKAAFLAYAAQAFFSFSVCITAPFFWMLAAFLAKKKE